MTEMNDNEVLSILNKMDEEERTYRSLFGARQYVKDVIVKFREAKKFLSEIESIKANHEASIANLAKQLEEGQAKIAKQLEAETNVMNSTLDDIGKQLVKVRAEYDEVDKKLKDKQKEAREESARLDTMIAEKTKELNKVTISFESFKKQHGLA